MSSNSNQSFIKALITKEDPMTGLTFVLDISGSMKGSHTNLTLLFKYLQKIFDIFNIKVNLILFSDYCNVYKRVQHTDWIKNVPELSEDEVFILRERLNSEEFIATLMRFPINYLGNGGDSDEAHETVLQILRKICDDKSGIIMITDAKAHRAYYSNVHRPDDYAINAQLERLVMELYGLNSTKPLNIVEVNPTDYPEGEKFIIHIINLINNFINTGIISIARVSTDNYLTYFNSFIELVNAFPRICLEQNLNIWQLYHDVRVHLSAFDPTINDKHSKMLDMAKRNVRELTDEMLKNIKNSGLSSFAGQIEEYKRGLSNLRVLYRILKIDPLNPLDVIGHISQFNKVSLEFIGVLNALKFYDIDIEIESNPVYEGRPDSLFNALCDNKTIFSITMIEKLIVWILFSNEITNENLKKYCLECFINIYNTKVNGFDMTDKWYLSSFGLQSLINAIQLIGDQNNLLEKFKYKLMLRTLRFEKLKKNISQKYNLRIKSNKKIMQLIKCASKQWMPSNMILPNGDCIYCTGIHTNHRSEDDGNINEHHGLRYHDDGTTPIVPTYILNSSTAILLVSESKPHIQTCSNCCNNYFMYDTRGLASRKTPLCFACRKGKDSNEVYTNVCMNCNDKYTMPAKNAMYVCDTCTFGKWRIEIGSVNITELIKMFPFVNDIILDESDDITVPKEVTDVYVNIIDLIQNLKRHVSCDYDNMNYCVIGACNTIKYVELYSMCSFCNLKACKDCIMNHINSKLDMKYAHGIEDFQCLCQSYIKPNDMYKDINQLILNIPDTNKMVSICPDCKIIVHCDRQHNQCNADVHENLDAEKCESCLNKYIESLKQQEILNDNLATGYYYMKTPCCGILTAKDNNTCAHMTCQCRKHWCWLCRSIFDRAEHCYEHMREEHDDVDYMHISKDREPIVKMEGDIDKRQ
jgi:hypothetical protein